MFKLRAVQAAFGDCLLLEYGTESSPHRILIDGGPADVFPVHLKPELEKIAQLGAPLDLVVLSHVDTDHVTGLLDYLAELRVVNNGLPVPKALWHNSFAATVDPNGVVQPRLAALITASASNVMTLASMAVQGIQEGASLRTQALTLSLPINDGFPGNLLTVESAQGPMQFENLELTVVGPTQANLDNLEQKWIEWLDAHENSILSADPFVMANSDGSVPNLSSIMLYAKADNRTMLLTGDGRSDHLLNGLGQAGLLDAAGKMHVDVLKLPHHGSDRNMTKTFFKKITADIYVASANGRDGNPDLATLIWLVEAAKEQQRQVEIVVTNETPSVTKLLEEYPPSEYTYSLKTMPVGDHSIVV
ncbi:MAG TPA: MBL fold metallo-hydrolase [Pyrinomonadaceae bacterium]|jgi:beta-lactamase superfamily II metal-dependent hydrolase|nr:MBL fold metallo-hydrolase [Pyrinomonadaceae bacterium]